MSGALAYQCDGPNGGSTGEAGRRAADVSVLKTVQPVGGAMIADASPARGRLRHAPASRQTMRMDAGVMGGPPRRRAAHPRFSDSGSHSGLCRVVAPVAGKNISSVFG